MDTIESIIVVYEQFDIVMVHPMYQYYIVENVTVPAACENRSQMNNCMKYHFL